MSVELTHVLIGLDEQVIALTFAEDRIATAANLISDVPGLDAFFAAGS